MSFAVSARTIGARMAFVSALLAFVVAFGSVAFAQEKPAAAPDSAQLAGEPTVAAAASLRYALDEIAARYTAEK